MSKPLQNTDAFVDLGYPEGHFFCEKFLSSPEFTSDLLKEINKKFKIEKRSPKKDKEGYAYNLAQAIRFKELSANDLLLEYVKKPRVWLSFKIGSCSNYPDINKPEILLKQFGEVGWYGPIKEFNSSKVWYIKTHKFDHHIPQEAYIDHDGKTKSFDLASIRWPIIAEVDEKYLALHWMVFLAANLSLVLEVNCLFGYTFPRHLRNCKVCLSANGNILNFIHYCCMSFWTNIVRTMALNIIGVIREFVQNPLVLI